MNEVFIRTRDLPEWLAKKYFCEADLHTIEELIGIIEELDGELERIMEAFEDFKQNVEENYKFIGTKEQIGYHEGW